MCDIERSGYIRKQATAFRVARDDGRKCLCILRKRTTTFDDVHFPDTHFIWRGVGRTREHFQVVWIKPCGGHDDV